MKIYSSENRWINEILMIEYLKDIIIPYCKSEHSILMVDSYEAHFSKKVREFLKDIPYLHLMVISGGITSIAHPDDVGINARFKAVIRQHSIKSTNESWQNIPNC